VRSQGSTGRRCGAGSGGPSSTPTPRWAFDPRVIRALPTVLLGRAPVPPAGRDASQQSCATRTPVGSVATLSDSVSHACHRSWHQHQVRRSASAGQSHCKSVCVRLRRFESCTCHTGPHLRRRSVGPRGSMLIESPGTGHGDPGRAPARRRRVARSSQLTVG